MGFVTWALERSGDRRTSRRRHAKVWKLSAREKECLHEQGWKLLRKFGRNPNTASDSKKNESVYRTRQRHQKAKMMAKNVSRGGLFHKQREKVVREGKEPNPGPSSLWCGVTLNYASLDNTWALVDLLTSHRLRPDVVCLQETFLNARAS